MTKPPFTPGPWECAPSVIGEGVTIWATDPFYGIAKVLDLTGKPENEANARLIAAAPDLHEALDWLLACVLAEFEEVHPDDKEERLILACGAARTALAKANGQ
jgi:hypothetical protein